MNRRTLILALGGLSLAPLLSCSPASLFRRTSLGRYVSEVREPLTRFASWAEEVLAFYRQTLSLQTIGDVCSEGTPRELLAEGETIVAQLSAIDPPSALAPAHEGVVKAGEGIVANLREVHTLLCESKDLEAAKRAAEQAGADVGQLLEQIESLRSGLE